MKDVYHNPSTAVDFSGPCRCSILTYRGMMCLLVCHRLLNTGKHRETWAPNSSYTHSTLTLWERSGLLFSFHHMGLIFSQHSVRLLAQLKPPCFVWQNIFNERWKDCSHSSSIFIHTYIYVVWFNYSEFRSLQSFYITKYLVNSQLHWLLVAIFIEMQQRTF